MSNVSQRKLSLAVGGLLLGSLFILPSANAVPLTTAFELDGNATNAAAAGDDWSSFYPASTSTTAFNWSIVHEPTPDTTYFTIGSKDIEDVSQWFSGGNSAPDKDEILDGFAASYNSSTDGMHLFFGADRYANNGDAAIGFWFLQGAVGIGPAGQFTGSHVKNDTFVVSHFTNGGAVATIYVYAWDTSAPNNLKLLYTGADCQSVPASAAACARVNAASAASPWPFQSKGNNAPANTFLANELFEGGVNLTALYGANLPCFNNFLVETRSSQETTATLKDFLLGGFHNCPIVPPQATPSIEKAPHATPVPIGSPIGYEISVLQSGPDTAVTLNVTDTLPDVSGAWSVDDATHCSIAGLALECHYTDVPAFTTLTLNVTADTSVTALETDCGAHDNFARAIANEGLSTVAQDQSGIATVYVTCADVGVVKTAADDSVSLGDAIGFDVVVTSYGPDAATGVTLTDTLPSVAGGFSLSGDNATDCTLTGDDLSCSFGTLASGETRSVTLTATPGASDCTLVSNTAHVTADIDTDATNNESTDSTTVLCPDLSIEKAADADTVSAGEGIGFTITVSNAGPGIARDVTLSDPLPGGDGVEWSIDPANADCSIAGTAPTQTLECDFGDLADDASASVHVVSATAYDSCGLYENTATASASNHDDASASDSTTVECPDVSVEKTADDAIVNATEPIGFTITVTNGGPGTASDVTLSDPLPGGDGIDWSIDPANADCAITGTAPTQTLECDFGDLAASASASVHVVSATAYASCGLYENTATASASNHPDASASDATSVQCPDLSIEKLADDASVDAGEDIGFTITVSNAGPGTALGVTLDDPLPGGDGVDWSIDPANADCAITGTAPTQTLACDFGDLAATASASVHVVSATTYDSCGAYENVATASSSNNPDVSASDTTTVECADLSIEKAADDATVSAGEDIGFTITVSNGGSGTAAGVTLSDPLPGGDGIDWGIDPANADCSITGTAPAQTLECDFGDLAATASASVHVVSGTTFDSCAQYENTATASASNHPDVSATGSTTVECPDLSIDKDADAASVSAGEDIGFTITVSNAGPGTAADVTLSDPLPGGDGIDWSIDPANADCAITGTAPTQTLECDFGDLASGASASVHVTSGTTSASCAAHENTATASASNHADASATASTTVLCPDLDVLKTADAASVDAGEDIGFTITVSNGGPGVAADVTLSDPLPGGVATGWSIDPANADCAITGAAPTQALECDFGDLADDASVSVHVVSATTFADCGAYPNTATASASNQASVDSTDTTEVLCPDLSLVKTADAASVEAGGSIGFTLWLNNTGDGAALGATLTDALPGGSGVSWSIDPANADCAITGTAPAQTLECDFGEIAGGAGASVHVTSGTTTASCADYPNSATAGATNHADVQASASTSVTCSSQVTRTQGFWSTHTAYTQRVFDDALGGTLTIGGGSHTRTIDTYGKLFGAWYSDIAKKTTGQGRASVDKARMALLQQLVTAELNCNAFGCNATTAGYIAQAHVAYANGDKGAMATLTGLLDAYNNGGDSLALPTTYGSWNPATPDLSSAIANRVYWNSP